MNQENENNEQEITKTTIVNEPVQAARVYQGSARTTTTVKDSSWSPNAARVVYYILGVLEALLGIRLILKLLGANPKSAFVSFISIGSGYAGYG